MQSTYQSMAAHVRGLGARILRKLVFLTQATLEVKDIMTHTVLMVLSVAVQLSTILPLLMSLARERISDGEYFTLEDAVGRVLPIHLRTISSWEAFAFVLSEKFKGTRGARRVRDRRYNLLENGTRRVIEQGVKPWEQSFLPHQKILMSLICSEPLPEDNTSHPATCPWCRTEPENDGSALVQWLVTFLSGWQCHN
jgi:hypothetical protein